MSLCMVMLCLRFRSNGKCQFSAILFASPLRVVYIALAPAKRYRCLIQVVLVGVSHGANSIVYAHGVVPTILLGQSNIATANCCLVAADLATHSSLVQHGFVGDEFGIAALPALVGACIISKANNLLEIGLSNGKCISSSLESDIQHFHAADSASSTVFGIG